MPKVNYYQKAGEPGPLERVKDERGRRNILKAVRVTEIHIFFPVSPWESSKVSLFVPLGN